MISMSEQKKVTNFEYYCRSLKWCNVKDCKESGTILLVLLGTVFIGLPVLLAICMVTAYVALIGALLVITIFDIEYEYQYIPIICSVVLEVIGSILLAYYWKRNTEYRKVVIFSIFVSCLGRLYLIIYILIDLFDGEYDFSLVTLIYIFTHLALTVTGLIVITGYGIWKFCTKERNVE